MTTTESEVDTTEAVEAPTIDDIGDALAQRVMDADHIVAAALQRYGAHPDYASMQAAAIRERRVAVAEDRYMHALIHDEVARFCQNQIDDGNDP